MADLTKEELSKSLIHYTYFGIIVSILAATIGAFCGIQILRIRSAIGVIDTKEKNVLIQRVGAAEAATKPRRLSPEQRAKLVESLSQLEDKPKIFMCAGILDAESVTFGEDIESALVTAGFDVYFPKTAQMDAALMVGPPGIHFVVKDPTIPNKAGKKVQMCFFDAGIEMFGLRSDKETFPEDRIEIAIGQR